MSRTHHVSEWIDSSEQRAAQRAKDLQKVARAVKRNEPLLSEMLAGKHAKKSFFKALFS